MTASPLPSPAEPLVIVGAGPIGLAAAAHAHSRGLSTLVLETGSQAGASVREWGHVRLFSPWRELIDPAAESLLARTGWGRPDPDSYPTGDDWVEQYLAPLAAALDATDLVEVRFGSRVVGVAKQGRDRLVDSGRESAPFTVHVESGSSRTRLAASAVIDASGTWTVPNPLGADGLPALGEAEHCRAHLLRHPGLQRSAGAGALRGQAGRCRRSRRLRAEHACRADRPQRRSARHHGGLAAPAARHR